MMVGLLHFHREQLNHLNQLERNSSLNKAFKPKVIPIVIDGFRRSFDKKGLMIKKGILQSMIIKIHLK